MTKFSIIIPFYNVEENIRKCLDSIENQTFKDFEVLCVDDCGTDSSVDIVREFVEKDNRFKLLRHEQNKGVSAARNTALKALQGEYIIFVDSDDWIELETLEKVNLAYEKSNADGVLFGYNRCWSDGRIEAFPNSVDDYFPIKPEMMNTLCGCIWNKSFRASKIKEFEVDFPVGLVIEDTEFSFKALCQMPNFYVIKDVLYNYYNDREGSITTYDITNERIEDTFTIIERIYDFCVEKNIFKKYRIFFLKIIGDYSPAVIGTASKKDIIVRIMDRILTKMNFPEAFKDMDTEAKILTFWKN